MSNQDIRRLVDKHWDDPGTGWSMGTIGAIAEFVRDPDESVTLAEGFAVTGRGGIRLTLPETVRALAYETPAGPHNHWNHTVALCLPITVARRAARTAVTELGPDGDSLRLEDRGGVLFDLGLGTPTVDVCVRTTDSTLITRLRAAAGTPLFAPASTTARTIIAAQPHRVFSTACGRVEVYAAIPPPEGRSPDGPHTHLLPHLIRTGRTHPATAPVPDGFVPCAHLYPPHPTTDRSGHPLPFDAERHRAFQELLARFGDPEQSRIKAATINAVRTGGPVPTVSRPLERVTIAVALRQLVHTDRVYSALDARWSRHRTPDDLLDPEGDPHGG